MESVPERIWTWLYSLEKGNFSDSVFAYFLIADLLCFYQSHTFSTVRISHSVFTLSPPQLQDMPVAPTFFSRGLRPFQLTFPIPPTKNGGCLMLGNTTSLCFLTAHLSCMLTCEIHPAALVCFHYHKKRSHQLHYHMHFCKNDGKMATATEDVDSKTLTGVDTYSVH